MFCFYMNICIQNVDIQAYGGLYGSCEKLKQKMIEIKKR